MHRLVESQPAGEITAHMFPIVDRKTMTETG